MEHNSQQCIQEATYDEVKDLPNHPHKLLIDVREPEELENFGQIPSNINIPLDIVDKELSHSVEEKAFRAKYGKHKPQINTEIILYCRSGRRSGLAAEKMVHLGYKNVKNYKGSWLEWAKYEGLPC